MRKMMVLPPDQQPPDARTPAKSSWRSFIPVSALFPAVIPAALGQMPPAAAPPETPAAAVTPTPADPVSVRATLNKYCVMCHNAKLKSGSVALDAVDTKNIGLDAST